MRSFLVVPNQGQKIKIHIFALERKTSCTYHKEKRLEQRDSKMSRSLGPCHRRC
jgi:hypothetical protein